MGSLENGVLPLKRDPLLKSSSRNERSNSFVQRPRSRFARFMVLKKLDYLQWICAVGLFIVFMFVFQMFLPLSTVEKAHEVYLKERADNFGGELQNFLKEIGGLDFGEGVKFEPTKRLLKFQREHRDVDNVSIGGSRRLVRFGHKKPQLAFVYSLEDGPVHAVWENIGVPVNIVEASGDTNIMIDWLNYDGILVNSLEAKDVISGNLLNHYLLYVQSMKRHLLPVLSGHVGLIDDWKAVFNRATVVVFPNHALPMFYAAFDAGNYFVIPGSPSGACKLDNSTIIVGKSPRMNMNIGACDLVIAINRQSISVWVMAGACTCFTGFSTTFSRVSC